MIARAERAVTDVVFSKWNEVFGENVGNKQIEIELQYDKGKPIKGSNGAEIEPNVHDCYIRFWVKEGTNRYKVEDRSLGFRWFFSFLLFTQFRIFRERSKATFFLFDEPASNLHAAAQKKLLESFPAIAKAPHRLIYSTHSHYMIEPAWLEQAYIVHNTSMDSVSSVIQEGVTRDADIDVQVVPYRKFVQSHPANTSYFQPILDTLEVVPSHLDQKQGGLIVEGKGDFYYILLAARVLRRVRPRVFPARGSGTMGALVSLHRGWGQAVRVLFDADKGGKDGKKNLQNEFVLFDDEIFSLKDLDPNFTKIEDMFSAEDADKLLGGSPFNKSQLMRRVQEMLAANEKITFDRSTRTRMAGLLDALKVRAPDAF